MDGKALFWILLLAVGGAGFYFWQGSSSDKQLYTLVPGAATQFSPKGSQFAVSIPGRANENGPAIGSARTYWISGDGVSFCVSARKLNDKAFLDPTNQTAVALAGTQQDDSVSRPAATPMAQMTPVSQMKFNPRAIPTYSVQGGFLQKDVPQGNNDIVASSQPYVVHGPSGQPPTASALKMEPSVAQAIAATEATTLMQSIHGGLISKRTPIAIGNGAYPGMEVCGQIMQADEKIGVTRGNGFRMRVFVDGPRARIFSFLVLGNTKEVNSKEATKFLTSVQI